ncbi:hypothetical protein ACFOUP_13670 [Belliella kenyensis]|uniref:Uncharacterized protein n=1 Tax=Belliella kenyensis TaxID=1472724 RepID=A0ABV8ENF0_9BACT|nr:hypothetical protein [Belliella kenyensis]MCH7401492.1 hypothetical protein [Belliella kenyensis]MDN3603227.1 hypothetical protein [Belliella kenyensis]
MKFSYLLVLLLHFSIITNAQNEFDWDASRALSLQDFQSKRSSVEGDKVFIHPTINLGFDIKMSNYEFMFTKNFNDKVTCKFNPKSSILISENEQQAKALIKFTQYQFDLHELHARKLRKRMLEGKGVFSDISFIQPLFQKTQEELAEEIGEVTEQTNIGLNEELLLSYHLKVLDEIETLKDFCKTCKPPKASKKGK